MQIVNTKRSNGITCPVGRGSDFSRGGWGGGSFVVPSPVDLKEIKYFSAWASSNERTVIMAEFVFPPPLPSTIGVWDQFRLGGLRSVARIFSLLLARKSSGFARILHDFFFGPKIAI